MNAPDAMSQAAIAASMAVSNLDYRLYVAGDTTLSREERSKALVRVFTQWRGLCDKMKALEDVAPNAAASGYQAHERIVDFVEARQVAA